MLSLEVLIINIGVNSNIIICCCFQTYYKQIIRIQVLLVWLFSTYGEIYGSAFDMKIILNLNSSATVKTILLCLVKIIPLSFSIVLINKQYVILHFRILL